jgi:hypothetical protein
MRGQIAVEILQHKRLLGRGRLDKTWGGPQPLGHQIKLAMEALAITYEILSTGSGALSLLGLERLE